MQPQAKIKLIVVSSLFTYSLNVAAVLSCGSGSGVSNSFSLRNSGKSLASMQVQDQDGLGTCYANSLSLALEAELGSPVSYHEIAIRYGVARNASAPRARAVVSTDATTGRRSLINEGGWACEAFNALKQRTPAKICKRNDVPLEHLENPSDQQGVMESLAQFYDALTDFKKSNKTKADQFAPALRELLTSSTASSTNRCVEMLANPNRKAEGMERHIQSYCFDQYLNLQSAVKAEAKYKVLKDALPDVPDNARQRASLQTEIVRFQHKADEARKKIRKLGSMDTDPELTGLEPAEDAAFPRCVLKPGFTQIFKDHVGKVAEEFNRDGNLNPLGSMRKVVDRFLDEKIGRIAGIPSFPKEIFANFEGTPHSEATLQSILRKDLAQAVPSVCRSEITWRAMQNPRLIQETFYRSAGTCLPQNLVDFTTQAFEGLGAISHGAFPARELIDAVTRVDGTLDDFVMGVIGPGCVNNALNIPEALTCDQKVYPLGLSDAEKNGKTPEQVAALARQKSIEHARGYIESSLTASPRGRPVMVSVCTGFLANDTMDSNFNTNCVGGAVNHGYHEMTVIGTRCKNGKIEYQVQNSWGQGCGSYTKLNLDATPPSSTVLYDCNETGGYIWVPEDVLVTNTDKIKKLQ